MDGKQTNVSVDAPTREESDIFGKSFTISFDTSLGELKAIYSDRELDWFDYLDLMVLHSQFSILVEIQIMILKV